MYSIVNKEDKYDSLTSMLTTHVFKLSQIPVGDKSA